jgi:predicted methyltransferase
MHPFWFVPIALIAAAASQAADPVPADPGLQQVIQGPHRSKVFSDRDVFRHPLPELEFCGVAPTSTVVEIWPAGSYWTEILAPYLRGKVRITEFGRDHYDIAPISRRWARPTSS